MADDLPDTPTARRAYLIGLAQGLRCQAIPLAEAYGDERAAATLREMLADAERLSGDMRALVAQRSQLERLAARAASPSRH
jgi:hypothetical protein